MAAQRTHIKDSALRVLRGKGPTSELVRDLLENPPDELGLDLELALARAYELQELKYYDARCLRYERELEVYNQALEAHLGDGQPLPPEPTPPRSEPALRAAAAYAAIAEIKSRIIARDAISRASVAALLGRLLDLLPLYVPDEASRRALNEQILAIDV